jgi:hypothetical protein
MKPAKLRQLLSQYGELGRIYCTPEDKGAQKQRKKKGGNSGRLSIHQFCLRFLPFLPVFGQCFDAATLHLLWPTGPDGVIVCEQVTPHPLRSLCTASIHTHLGIHSLLAVIPGHNCRQELREGWVGFEDKAVAKHASMQSS